MLSNLSLYTTTVDKLCIIPTIGFPVGFITILSNTAKTAIDIPKLALAAFHCVGSDKKLEEERVKLAKAYSQAKQDFWQHITFIFIGIFRMVPFVGGLMTWAYNTRQSNQLIAAGDAALDDGKRTKVARPLYERAVALSGSSTAMLKIAQIYRDFHVEEKSKEECNKLAFEWVKRAIDRNNPKAYVMLQSLIYHKKLDKPELERAFTLLEKAANANHPQAQTTLGVIYKGAAKHIDSLKLKARSQIDLLANSWLMKAAEQSDAFAHFHLAENYYYGQCGLKSLTNAHEHYLKAVELGCPDAEMKLAFLLSKGQFMPKNKEAQQESIRLINKAINDKDSRDEVVSASLYVLGKFYENGWGVKRSYKEARRLFEESADMGYVWAQTKLKEMDKFIPRMARKILCQGG